MPQVCTGCQVRNAIQICWVVSNLSVEALSGRLGHLQIFADSHRGFGPIVSLSVNSDARSLQIVSTGWHCTRLRKPVQRQETNFKTSKTLENHSWVLLVLVSPCNKITECVRMHYALI